LAQSFVESGKLIAGGAFNPPNGAQLLFKSNKLDANGIPVEGWDGTFKGQPMPQDGYAWYIKAVFRNGQKWSGMKYNQKENGSRGHTFGKITLFR
jgi:hypothetical protein